MSSNSSLYYEENSVLPEEAVLSIMQDDSALALPQLKPLPEADAQEEYMMVLRDMQTNREYMHSEAVTSLDNWHCFFVDCPLMKGLNFTSSVLGFPADLKPPSSDSAVLVRVFSIQNRAFKLTVTRAPPSDEGRSILFYALTSSSLPVNYAMFERLCKTSMERKACLRQYAALSLMDSKGVQVTSPAVTSPPELNFQQLSLEHGPQIFHGMGTKSFYVSGWFEMHEAEQTAASSSLPMLLKHLYFLQSNHKGPLYYHIKAPNKYAYMVLLRNVGGMEIYLQVNMHASLAAMQNAFTSSVISRSFPSFRMTPKMNSSNSSLAQKTFMLQNIQTQKSLFSLPSGEVDPSTMDENDFVAHMKRSGLEILEKELEGDISFLRRQKDIQGAQKVLEKLLVMDKGGGKVAALSLDDCLKAACMAFTGITKDVWANLEVDGDGKSKAKAFIRLLSKESSIASYYYRFKDFSMYPLLIQSCLDCTPYKWWERFLPLCELQGSPTEEESKKSAYLCVSILYHADKYRRFFPEVFSDAATHWEKAVEDACIADSFLGNAKETYESLLDASKSISTDENTLAFYYVQAVAYLMLLGKGETEMKRLLQKIS